MESDIILQIKIAVWWDLVLRFDRCQIQVVGRCCLGLENTFDVAICRMFRPTRLVASIKKLRSTRAVQTVKGKRYHFTN